MTPQPTKPPYEPQTAIPRALEPYVNKYGENVKEFSERYQELR